MNVRMMSEVIGARAQQLMEEHRKQEEEQAKRQQESAEKGSTEYIK